MKRLAMYLDGTWNTAESRTNVKVLDELTAEHDVDGNEQARRYDPGVGTRWGERVLGGWLGLGLDDNVIEAYDWLSSKYADGDLIYLFGFSRGAFTARSLAGMVARHGLPEQPAERGSEIFEFYRRTGHPKLAPGCRHVPIHFLGVWDTVGALGIPFGRIRGLSRSTTQFHDTYPSTRYLNAFQALAVDEFREAFSPTLWTRYHPGGPPFQPWTKTLEQRWFVGAHTDVGGRKPESRLARIPARWMQERAQACGLAFTADIAATEEDALAPIQNSFRDFMLGAYWTFHRGRPFLRTIGRAPWATKVHNIDGFSASLNEVIDATVTERWRKDPDYRPKNLLDWAARRGVDPATLFGDTPL